MPSRELEARFDEAMIEVYQRALNECGYKATRFLHMLQSIAGWRPPGFCCTPPTCRKAKFALWERKRLDLTVEVLILGEEWHPLFTEAERETARKRLAQYNYSAAK
jgi:hypothetical protein